VDVNSITQQHSQRMKALLEFTATSLRTDFPSPFGSAIYERQSGLLICQSYDTVMRECDLTNHAEVNTIRLATQKLRRLSLRGFTLYSTCEPCPMCMSACIWAELDTVVFGASTMEDATIYWPQLSDITPQELVARMQIEPKCILYPHVERALCQDLFRRCDEVRVRGGFALPPNR
jgi:tRNA(Arg) A34 adenosine deaminase TadA